MANDFIGKKVAQLLKDEVKNVLDIKEDTLDFKLRSIFREHMKSESMSVYIKIVYNLDDVDIDIEISGKRPLSSHEYEQLLSYESAFYDNKVLTYQYQILPENGVFIMNYMLSDRCIEFTAWSRLANILIPTKEHFDVNVFLNKSYFDNLPTSEEAPPLTTSFYDESLETSKSKIYEIIDWNGAFVDDNLTNGLCDMNLFAPDA